MVILDSLFTNTSIDGFVYRDDTFRGTRQPAYASGYTETTNDGKDAITVELGGINGTSIYNMSGGWSRRFTLLRRSDIVITIVFQLEIASNFESSEISQVLCSIDGTLVSNGTVNYLAQILGDGDNNGGNMVIGFQTIDVSVPDLAIGSHTIVVGGHLSRKTSSDEISWFRFAYIRIEAEEL
jgi:hypothetical protein